MTNPDIRPTKQLDTAGVAVALSVDTAQPGISSGSPRRVRRTSRLVAAITAGLVGAAVAGCGTSSGTPEAQPTAAPSAPQVPTSSEVSQDEYIKRAIDEIGVSAGETVILRFADIARDQDPQTNATTITEPDTLGVSTTDQIKKYTADFPLIGSNPETTTHTKTVEVQTDGQPGSTSILRVRFRDTSRSKSDGQITAEREHVLKKITRDGEWDVLYVEDRTGAIDDGKGVESYYERTTVKGDPTVPTVRPEDIEPYRVVIGKQKLSTLLGVLL